MVAEHDRSAEPGGSTRSSRLARALLRVYPCDWRKRYGDEFLALIAEFGLTWRSAADIVRAAAIERVARLVRLARAEAVPTNPLPELRPWTDREFLLMRAGLIPLMSLTMVALSAIGIPYPHWWAWIQLIAQPLLHFDEQSRLTDATIGERIVLAFAWVLASILVVAVGLMVGSELFRLALSEATAFLCGMIVLLVGLSRVLYRFVCSRLNKPRPDVTGREMAAWHVALFAMLVLVGAAASPPMVFWSMTITCFLWMRFTRVRHVRAARWRQVREQRGF